MRITERDVTSYLFTYLRLSILTLNGGGTGSPMYHLTGNVISATIGLVYINLQPEYELPSSTGFGQFWKLGKIGVGGTFLPSHP